jgi:L-Ala-D/L-Glu epimerase
MIRDIRVEKKVMHFNAPFKIAYEEVTEAEIVLIALTDGSGNIGLGSAAPDPEVTGETVEKDFNELKKILTPDFFKNDISKLNEYHLKIQEAFKGLPAAQNAVEEALLHLWSLNTGILLHKFFGGYRKSVPIMFTIGIKSPKDTLDDIENRLTQGFKIIKLKIGLDWEEDAYKVLKSAELISERGRLVLDANQGYSMEDAKQFINKIKNTNAAVFEQPVDAKNPEGLKELHLSTKIPIIGDESCVTAADAEKLLKGNYVSGVNVKLMKCGGPLNFIEIFNIAKSLNKIFMIGCMYESNISITTGAHLALGLPIDYVDLDSAHLDFHDDPTIGGAQVGNGAITVSKVLKLNE